MRAIREHDMPFEPGWYNIRQAAHLFGSGIGNFPDRSLYLDDKSTAIYDHRMGSHDPTTDPE